MRTGPALIAIGAVLALGSFLIALENDAPSAGDVAMVEESLLRSTDNAGRTTTAEIRTSTTHSALNVPLWQPNSGSRLGTDPQDPAPTMLTIDSLGINAPIGPYGVDASTGQMEVPANVTEVAWYRHGPAPGQPGSAVLAAHVDLEGQGPGVFFDLGQLEPGDDIEVQFSDGTSMRFSVVARQTYQKEELPLRVVFSRAGDPVLTLVTCGGGFDSSASRYDSNVVIYATPITSGRASRRALIDLSPGIVETHT